MNMITIGITGTQGSGKGTVVKILIKDYKFTHYSVSDLITESIIAKNLPVNRDTMRQVANQIRKDESPDYLIRSMYKKAQKGKKNCIIESVRNTHEAKFIKSLDNSALLAVDADVKLRYERILKRGSSKDNVTFDHFLAQENKENKEKSHKMNITKCIKLADYKILNNSTFKDLEEETKKFYNWLTTKRI